MYSLWRSLFQHLYFDQMCQNNFPYTLIHQSFDQMGYNNIPYTMSYSNLSLNSTHASAYLHFSSLALNYLSFRPNAISEHYALRNISPE